MYKKSFWITQTALHLALVVVLQGVTKPMGQLVTGSCVNMALAMTVLLVGCSSGLIVAFVSPIAAYLLGIAPQLVTVPGIMAGNGVFVLVLNILNHKSSRLRSVVVLGAAVAKFLVIYIIVVKVICGPAASMLIKNELLKEPMLTQFTIMFAWPQLVTALLGGGIAVLISPTLKRALRSEENQL